ncbi:MAG: hypothetical protein LBH00_03140 [Planctomycetaceae bacterium]|jgi:hypothetical protein|nr:hypothetical protein [Planctomycetaceae bacterium]
MHVKATLSGFCIVSALYLLYGYVLVPLVLPVPAGGNTRTTDSPKPQQDDSIRSTEIAPYFDILPENGWERDNSREIHLLQFAQFVFLFGQDTIEGKLVRLEPCTIIALPDNKEHFSTEELKDTIRRSFVLRTPQYAEIEFDNDFDISKMPNFVCVRLFGKVSVQSDMEETGTQDDFSLETENIIVSDSPAMTKIEALKDVKFALGKHFGTGSGLTVEIVQTGSGNVKQRKNLNRILFQKIKNLHFECAGSRNTGSPNSGTKKTGLAAAGEDASVIDVRCQGPFVLANNEAENGWTASFYRNVDAQRSHPDKTVDRLTADEVHITLQQKTGSAAQPSAEKTDMDWGNLEPVLFVARGLPGTAGQLPVPARLEAKHDADAALAGDEIFLDLRKGFLSLSARDRQETPNVRQFVEMIFAGRYTIRSERCVQYTFGTNPAETFGQFAADGKGNLSGKAGEGNNAKDVYLEWNEMQIEPHPLVKNQIMVKLGKGIKAQLTDFGTMTADKLDLCCNLTSSGSKQESSAKNKDFLLDHAIVRDNVLFETAGGTCRVNRFDIFFVNTSADGTVTQSRYTPNILTQKAPVPPGGNTDTIRLVQHLEPLQTITPSPAQPSRRVANHIPNTPMTMPKPAGFVATQNLIGIRSSSAGKFAMTGNLMKMQVHHFGGQSSAEIIAIEGNVLLKENASSSAAGMGIEIGGDTVTIWNPAEMTTQIKITGQAAGGDAVFKGKGVELHANELNLARSDNKFWSPGAGRLIANVSQIRTPGTSVQNTDDKLIVEWNKDMLCDGKVIQFFGQTGKNSSRVRVLYQTQSLWCSIMEIHLSRKVMFFDDQSAIEPKAEMIRCAHDVYIRNRQVDAKGNQKSIDTANVAKLQYYVEKNYLAAEGPGEMSSTFIGSGSGFDKTLPSAGAQGGSKLNHLAVWFQDGIQGTLVGSSKIADITGRVIAAYCPAASWDDTIAMENVAAARKKGYTLECEKLRIAEVPNPVKQEDLSMELTASGNAVIDGGGVYGKAQTIKYCQSKSVVHFDGDVKIRTALSGQTTNHTAKSIQYNIETGSVNLVQANGLSIGN